MRKRNKKQPKELGDGYNRHCVGQHIQDWISLNGPGGLSKLCVHLGVSESLINKARAGRAPSMLHNRLIFCKGLGIEHEVLFPLKKQGKAG
jgi:hypothetical protein